MNDFEFKLPKPKIEAKFISTLNNADIEELCDATEDAILVDGGFGWINPPPRKISWLLEGCIISTRKIINSWEDR